MSGPGRKLIVVSLAALLAPGLAAATPLVGEWALDAEQCQSVRVTYTDDGRHEALVLEDGRWSTLSSGSYRLDGETLTVEAEGQTASLTVVRVDARTLELRSADAERMREIGTETVSFVRCPAR